MCVSVHALCIVHFAFGQFVFTGCLVLIRSGCRLLACCFMLSAVGSKRLVTQTEFMHAYCIAHLGANIY